MIKNTSRAHFIWKMKNMRYSQLTVNLNIQLTFRSHVVLKISQGIFAGLKYKISLLDIDYVL